MAKSVRSCSLFVAIFAVTALLNIPQALAYEETAGDYFSGISRKLGRGVWNVVSSPAELPCTIRSEVKSEYGGGAWTGIGRGSWNMVKRIIVGATEVMTFIIPMERTIPPVCSDEIVPIDAAGVYS